MRSDLSYLQLKQQRKKLFLRSNLSNLLQFKQQRKKDLQLMLQRLHFLSSNLRQCVQDFQNCKRGTPSPGLVS